MMFTAKPGRLILSCQPSNPDSPLNGASHMAAMAAAAEVAGATALRINSPEHVRAVKAITTLPVIGLWKQADGWGHRVITPDIESARALAEAGADVIALDATAESHPVPGRLAMLIEAIHEELHLPVMADISTVAEGVRAAGYGADLVGTTLSGYTVYSSPQLGPDLTLVSELSQVISVPVVAEGRYTSPEQARAALLAGASFVVVGNALTAPDVAAARFIAAMEPEAGPPTAERYWAEASVAIAGMQATHGPAVRQAADLMAQATIAGGAIHVFGAVPDGARGSEPDRVSVQSLLLAFPIGAADLFVIVSHSGGSGYAVELANEVKGRGHRLIAITSMAHARKFDSHHASGLHLHDIADVTIDNGAPADDAILSVPGVAQPICALSPITGALITQALTAETTRLLQDQGVQPLFHQHDGP